MKTTWKILMGLLLAFQVSALLLPLAASAKKPAGTIEIRLDESGSLRESKGVVFEAYRVADVQEEGLAFLPGYEDCTLTYADFDDGSKMKEAIALLESKKGTPQARAAVNEEGRAVFEDMPYGLYLFCAADLKEFDWVGSFLVLLPLWNGEENRYEDHVVISAKSVPLPDLQVLKVDANNLPITGKGFAFGWYGDEACKNLLLEKEGDSKTGTVRFRLKPGETRWLKETKAPAGYVLSKETVKVAMDAEGSLFVNGEEVQAQDGLIVYRYVNQPEEKDNPPAPSPNPEQPQKPETQAPPVYETQNPASPSVKKPSTAAKLLADNWKWISAFSGLALLLLALYFLAEKHREKSSR